MPGKEELEAELAKSRKRAPKLLFQAWQAVRDQNQKAFDKAFLTSVDHFDKGEGNKAESLDDLVGIHQSILLAAARHKGMQVPQMTERQKARVVTHESLGLPAPSSIA